VATRRLLIAGNSVSMPPQPGTHAYPERLAALVGDRWQIATIIRSGATIEQMEPEVLEALGARPHALVVQVGIHERAPRPLGPAARARLGVLKPRGLRDCEVRTPFTNHEVAVQRRIAGGRRQRGRMGRRRRLVSEPDAGLVLPRARDRALERRRAPARRRVSRRVARIDRLSAARR